jgi:hypothetical protein
LLGVEEAEMIVIALKQLNELQAQYRVLNDTYQATKSQVDNLNQLKSMNSGHYGFGNLDNGLDALHSWQSPVSTWQDALHHLSGGNPERYQALMEAYEKNHPSLSESHYARYTTPEKTARFKEDKAVNRAVQVQTTQGYAQSTNTHLQAVPLLRPDEVMRLPEKQVLIMRTGYAPVKAEQLIWYRSKSMKERACGATEVPRQMMLQHPFGHPIKQEHSLLEVMAS